MSSEYNRVKATPRKSVSSELCAQGNIREEYLLGEFRRGEHIGGAEARTKPVEYGSNVVVLEGPLEAVRVQRTVTFVPQFRQQPAQPGAAHLPDGKWRLLVQIPDWPTLGLGSPILYGLLRKVKWGRDDDE